jgi:hypothetical protein
VAKLNETALGQMQEELTHLSMRKSRVVAKGATHYIQFDLWFAKILADFGINNIAAFPPLFCYNS